MDQKPIQKWQTLKTKSNSIIFGGCWAYKSGLRIFVRAPEVPFFGTRIWALLSKVPFFTCPKMALPVPKRKFEDHFYKPNIPQKLWNRQQTKTKSALVPRKIAANKKMQENKPALKFNFT